MTTNGLDAFSGTTRRWFCKEFSAPTPAQSAAWSTISSGNNALVVAPTGSGKTLSAFLWSLDRLTNVDKPADPKQRCRVLYVSPLKALAYDVERNLRVPLDGIKEQAEQLGVGLSEVTVAMRTGDTTAQQRRQFAREPSDILITTPESLYLILTSAARETLQGIDTVIVDEVHAVSGTKRGAHLALCLERLDHMLPKPAQRIGLSATVRPVDETARFLAGVHPVEVVYPPTTKTIDLSLEVTVDDLAHLTDVDEYGQPSIWPSVTRRLYELITSHRSTIIFANSRLLTERLCARINELASEAGPINRSQPAHVMAQSEAAAGSPAVLARAHHGSMSREERLQVESTLKSGQLAAVVATSSLELGIDMGAVELVVQVGSPPSVASGLQRTGRAGHQVGAVSRAVMLATHRSDLVAAAVTSERMLEGGIEELRPPRNPVDVLAQHVVSMVSLDDWTVAELSALVSRAAPFHQLSESALRAVLDMLSGRYPSTAFSGLRPKLIWDRSNDVLRARPGAQRLAVLNGGTIPDRGLYGVFLSDGGQGSRVGELDEEMVYESRVGDVFLLGATSWRVDAITADRVLVSPAPGQPARMPFWKGEDPGRPAELGKAIGARLRQLTPQWLESSSLNDAAAGNLTNYVAEQSAATGAMCDDHTIVFERFRDELGDWRIIVHCMLGARVNRPWAMAISARLLEVYGIDGHVMATDDGIIIRIPDMPQPPDAQLIRFGPDEVDAIVTDALPSSTLFSARFRECAARALLLPRRGFQRRQPLWQQRQRAGQLFSVASEFADFPITAEAARECLEEYFDMPELQELMNALASQDTVIAEVVTERPSPFAQSLLMSYVAGNLYGEDEPMAERQVAAFNSGLLTQLLGENQQGLDQNVVAETVDWLQWLDGRELADVEDLYELLRVIGDVSNSELAQRNIDPSLASTLESMTRAVSINIAGQRRWITAEDAARYRDGFSVSLPDWIPTELLASVKSPMDDVLARYARTHGPFTTSQIGQRYDLAFDTAEAAMHRLDADGVVTHGRFTSDEMQWCATAVLSLLRRKTLESLRAEISPVPVDKYVAFLTEWQAVGSKLTGAEAVADVLGQLQGSTLPASAFESLVLPARVRDYQPWQLDELTSSGEMLWAGAGSLPGSDGWISLAYADTCALVLPPQDDSAISTPTHRAILDCLDVARFFRDLVESVNAPDSETLTALWDLVWGGWISNDSLAPLRAKIAGPAASARAVQRRPRRGSRLAGPARLTPQRSRSSPAEASGRWFRLPDREIDTTKRAYAATASLVDRNGVVVSGAPAGQSSGFAGYYPILSAMEDTGAIRRGYFVAGLGAAQFAEPGAVDKLRSVKPSETILLSACDPANPYGAGVKWPSQESLSAEDSATTGTARHRPGRKAGAYVVIHCGSLVCFVERGGRTILTYTTNTTALNEAARALFEAAGRGALPHAHLTHADGMPVTQTLIGDALARAGFRVTPKGLRSG